MISLDTIIHIDSCHFCDSIWVISLAILCDSRVISLAILCDKIWVISLGDSKYG